MVVGDLCRRQFVVSEEKDALVRANVRKGCWQRLRIPSIPRSCLKNSTNFILFLHSQILIHTPKFFSRLINVLLNVFNFWSRLRSKYEYQFVDYILRFSNPHSEFFMKVWRSSSPK